MRYWPRTLPILLLCLLSACSSMTLSGGTTPQTYQEIRASTRTGYIEVHKVWLKERRQDCRVQISDSDDIVYPGETGPDWLAVSIALYQKIEMGCPNWMLQHPK